jgi:hypothetical protein
MCSEKKNKQKCILCKSPVWSKQGRKIPDPDFPARPEYLGSTGAKQNSYQSGLKRDSDERRMLREKVQRDIFTSKRFCYLIAVKDKVSEVLQTGNLRRDDSNLVVRQSELREPSEHEYLHKKRVNLTKKLNLTRAIRGL